MWAAAGGRWGLRCGLRALLGRCDASPSPGSARGVCVTAVSCGSKNLLKKFASKAKKKFWYEGPSLGHLTSRSPRLEALMTSTARKTRKEDHVRLRALNGLLHKAVAELLSTPEVSQEICDLCVEVSKVSVSPDFSACRVYWKTTLSAVQNQRTEAALQRSAAHMRHLLMAQQTLRNVPPIVFVQDKESAAMAQIDQLLAAADFGPPAGRDDSGQDPLRNPDSPPLCDTPAPAVHPSLCGIDHEALNKQITEYKRRKEKGRGSSQ
ncbi:putative ribosome-binding factor A, mitochondrial isoform X1 [Lepus europaeus]|uniref:putative ribosome-binding factor A, mitochondrial isoform X1 n=1 Tax=Lepus europaeus TaxID=9983 RepID=UPI002B488E92|nr:putative ribosome-binding factor A, mitochondrial isoform X1 [Lepus europaeus]